MALTRDQKKAQVKDLTDKLKKAESVMFSHYIGLSVAEISELRSKLKDQDAEMRVAKKTLLKIAVKEAGMPDFDADILEGPVSCIFSFQDPLSGAQTAFKFGKDHDQVKILGGFFDGKMLSKEEAVELAKMPSRAQLLATFASMLRSPLVTFTGQCASPLSGFARALSELAEKGGAGDEPEAPETPEVTEATEETEVKDEEKPSEPEPAPEPASPAEPDLSTEASAKVEGRSGEPESEEPQPES